MIRSRGGCSNCRRRKKRCDQQRPWCSACRARGLQCTGYSKQLRWIEGTVNPSPAVNTAVAFVPGALSRASVPQSGLSSVSPSIVTVQGPAPSLTPELFRKCKCISTHQRSHMCRYLIEMAVLDSGLMRLYKTTGTCWIQPFFAEMSMQSRSISLLSAAIQTYFDGGGADLPVPSMELVDLGVKAFRAELTAYHRKLHPPTACAGLLLCILHVSLRVLLKVTGKSLLTKTVSVVSPGPPHQPISQDAGRVIQPEDWDTVSCSGPSV